MSGSSGFPGGQPSGLRDAPRPHVPTPADSMAGRTLAGAALARVEEAATGRVRVEDYAAVLGAITGEAALVAAELFDVEAATMAPGSAVFGDAINAKLSGDTADLAAAPIDSVMGILVAALVPHVAPLDAFGSLEGLYRHAAATIGAAPWGAVATTVPDDNRPTVLPLRVAYELRPAVDAAQAEAGLPVGLRHVPCALALASGLGQVQRQGMDVRMPLRIALEIAFGMAKMVPMSRRAFDAAARPESAGGQ